MFPNNIYYPERYHGHRRKRNFFEGWYYKLVDREGKNKYAIIPGVFLGQKNNTSHSFIQVLDGNTGVSHYVRFPLEDFWADKKSFQIRIGNNEFSQDRFFLDLKDEDIQVVGELFFRNQVPWPKRITAPGIMGWYSYMPFMECYHGVLSLDHTIEGRLEINQKTLDFTGGRGYMEKDWGRSFPRGWIWTQSNHFPQEGVSFMGSIASIPWLGSCFRGFLMGLWYEGNLYSFTTYNKSSLERLQIADDRASFYVINKRTGYALEGDLKTNRTGSLRAPYGQGMVENVRESLTAQVKITLQNIKKGGETIFSDTGHHGGLEICGERELLSNS